MNATRVASFVFAAALPLAGVVYAQSPSQSPSSMTRSQDAAPAKAFAGKISKDSNGNYVLQESSSNGVFGLDDQKAAKKYDGKNVVVTGTLDASNNTIHVEKIETAA